MGYRESMREGNRQLGQFPCAPGAVSIFSANILSSSSSSPSLSTHTAPNLSWKSIGAKPAYRCQAELLTSVHKRERKGCWAGKKKVQEVAANSDTSPGSDSEMATSNPDYRLQCQGHRAFHLRGAGTCQTLQCFQPQMGTSTLICSGTYFEARGWHTLWS